MNFEKIGPQHLERKAILYVRQSSPIRSFTTGRVALCNTQCAIAWSLWGGLASRPSTKILADQPQEV